MKRKWTPMGEWNVGTPKWSEHPDCANVKSALIGPGRLMTMYMDEACRAKECGRLGPCEMFEAVEPC